MNGADALLATMRANDVTTIFTNPGTTEIHLVAALDRVPEVQGVLCLFEGVATGAADGYARASGRAAATLLHLGPGLANGWANLHNARRAHTPILNIIGDHPDFHRLLDPPLNSNVAALAGALEGWHHRLTGPNDVTAGTTAALAAAYGPPGQVATLILGSDVAWGEVSEAPGAASVVPHRVATPPSNGDIARSLAALRTKRTALFVGGSAATTEQLALAQRVATATSARVIMETFPSIFDHGAGVVSPERLIYLSDFAVAQLRDLDTIILIGTTTPVPPFAYEAGPNALVAADCEVIELAPPGTDTLAALNALLDETRADALTIESLELIAPPTGALNAQSVAAAVAAPREDGRMI